LKGKEKKKKKERKKLDPPRLSLFWSVSSWGKEKERKKVGRKKKTSGEIRGFFFLGIVRREFQGNAEKKRKRGKGSRAEG